MAKGQSTTVVQSDQSLPIATHLGVSGRLAWISDAPGYAVSSCGKVVGVRRRGRHGSAAPRLLKHVPFKKNPYAAVALKIDKRTHTRAVAGLVASAFLPCRPHPKAWPEPIDGDPTNLTAENLAWRSPGEPPLCCPGCGRRGRAYHRRDSVCKECRLERDRKWRTENVESARTYNRDYARRRHQQRRADAIVAYGGRCACCGVTAPEFLSIDHVHGGGNKHRRSLNSKGNMVGSSNFYRWLEKNGYPRDGFQLLCHNCNFAKARYGTCPHQREEQS